MNLLVEKSLLIIKKTNVFSDYQKDELRRKTISIIFQDNNLLSDFTTIENVMMPLIIRGEKGFKNFRESKKNFERC